MPRFGGELLGPVVTLSSVLHDSNEGSDDVTPHSRSGLLSGLLLGVLSMLSPAGEPAPPTPQLMTSFEALIPGSFERIETNAGIFIAEKGRAEVNAAHAKTGKYSLRLFGGEERTVEFVPASTEQPLAFLTFHAERWTRRAPFSFRVLVQNAGVWSEVYRGDEVIRTGGFLTAISIPLTKTPERVRLVCTSPENSGILIDDFSLVPATPQRLVGVTVIEEVVPLIAGAKSLPLLRVRVETAGTLKPLSVTGLQVQVDEHDLITSVSAVAPCDVTFGEAVRATPEMTFRGQISLAHGNNDFLIVADATQSIDLDATLTASCTEVRFADGTMIRPTHPERLTHRAGIALRRAGQDGVHTTRIPGLATTRKGTLLAVYDLRHRRGGDLPGDIDVGLSRSTDGGRTWEPTQTIIDLGDDPNFRFDGVGDPTILVDRETGTIWVAGVWSHGNRGWFGSQPGLEPEETGQFILVRSDDDGVTWSAPINITKQIKQPEWAFLLQGPGKGITMRDGTLVFPAQYQDSLSNHRLPHSTIIYSRDHGATWEIGTGAFPDTTESQVVEREPGELMLNARYNRSSRRVVLTTRDMGRTWSEHPTSREALIEPRACQASLINVDQELGRDFSGRLLFSNPNSLQSRSRITIKASTDGGDEWSAGLLLDTGRGRGYSCMTMIDEQTVGIVYEGSQAQLTFQRLPLADLFSRKAAESNQ